MAKATVHSVIADVLRGADHPLTAMEIYDEIIKHDLYQFKSKNPFSIVRSQLKRHCVETSNATSAKVKYFKSSPDGKRFTLL